MDATTVTQYISTGGLWVLALVIFLEYLNLPGFPAGIILPVAGIWAKSAHQSILVILLVSTISALVASWILYGLGVCGGGYLVDKFTTKFPKQAPMLDKSFRYLRDKGSVGVFFAKLIPVFRTLIGYPAGVIRMDFWRYSMYSALGILVWNGVLMGLGYYLGEPVLQQFVR